jgi:hypothetical protein
VRRHDLQNEAEAEENSATPPTGLGKKIYGLADSDERVRRRARAAEARGEAGAPSGLKQNGQHQNDAVYDEQCEKKRVKH